MEWCIPIQTFQVENVQLGTMLEGQKPMISFAYKDNDMRFTALNILLPILPIKSYNPLTGRLILSLEDSPSTLRKILMLQDTILNSVFTNQHHWFPNQTNLRKFNDIKATFQSIINNTEMNLYCPINDNDTHGPIVYANNAWTRGIFSSGLLVPGEKIRAVIRLQGISFHINPVNNQWTGKFRLQHRILAVLIPSSKTVL